MPLYEYECLPHHHRFEVRHGINDDPVTACPDCGGNVRRVIHPVGLVFKGSGFYVTDSRNSNPASKSAESTSSDTKTSDARKTSASESKGTTSKSE